MKDNIDLVLSSPELSTPTECTNRSNTLLKLPSTVQLPQVSADVPIASIVEIPQRNGTLEVIPEEGSSNEASTIVGRLRNVNLMNASSFEVASVQEQKFRAKESASRRKSVDLTEADPF